MKSFMALALCICLILSSYTAALAATLGPVSEYGELLALCAAAGPGDTLLVAGELFADGHDALSTQAPLRIASEDNAALHDVRLHDAQVSFSGVQLLDTLTITGVSHVELGRGVTVEGAPGSSGIVFSGSGELLIDPDCAITGGSGSTAVSIQHRDGEFYAGIDGVLRGGSGETGGTGLLVSSLGNGGTMMISGKIHGGNGTAMGGNALNLYDLSGNAFITVTGRLKGGEGAIGGDGAQIVSAVDNVSIGIDGHISGGQGESYGGDALMLMNIGGASSVSLSGALTGGDALEADAQPGVSLLVIGDTSSSHTRVGDCMLQDGQTLTSATPAPTTTPAPTAPAVTPLPEITSAVEEAEALPTPDAPTPEPVQTPEPTEEAATELPEAPPAEASDDTAEAPSEDPVTAPVDESTAEPYAEPTEEPVEESADEPAEETAAGPSDPAPQEDTRS